MEKLALNKQDRPLIHYYSVLAHGARIFLHINTEGGCSDDFHPPSLKMLNVGKTYHYVIILQHYYSFLHYVMTVQYS